MAKFVTTQTFSDGDQVTSTTLNAIVSGLSASTDLLADSTITISSGQLAVGVITASNIGALSVTNAKLAADAVDGAKIADDSVDSEHYVAGSIDEEHYADGSVSYAKTKTADRAVQADMESETASHFVAPDQMTYHPGVAKAHGVVTMSDGSVTGYNVDSSASGSASERTITLSNTMANSTYTVLITPENASTTANAPVVSAKTTTTFTVVSGVPLGFAVFGDLA